MHEEAITNFQFYRMNTSTVTIRVIRCLLQFLPVDFSTLESTGKLILKVTMRIIYVLVYCNFKAMENIARRQVNNLDEINIEILNGIEASRRIKKVEN